MERTHKTVQNKPKIIREVRDRLESDAKQIFNWNLKEPCLNTWRNKDEHAFTMTSGKPLQPKLVSNTKPVAVRKSNPTMILSLGFFRRRVVVVSGTIQGGEAKKHIGHWWITGEPNFPGINWWWWFGGVLEKPVLRKLPVTSSYENHWRALVLEHWKVNIES